VTAPFFHFIDSEPGQHRRLDELIAGCLHEGVALLDQQPIALALLDFHERPLSVKLVAAQLEQELPILEPFAPILERDPLAAIPDDDSAGAVVPGGNLSFEVAVFDRVSSTLTASRLSFMSYDGPFGTAHDLSTPPISRRRSKWRLRAACLCTTNSRPGTGDSVPIGSGVVSGDRFARY
jgi:hypothetical protein